MIHHRGIQAALVALGVGVSAVAVALAYASEHHDAGAIDSALSLLIGWSFIVTGLIAWDRRPSNRFGPLMYAVGVAWFAASLRYADEAVPFTVGLLVEGLWIALLVHGLAIFPSGKFDSRLARVAVGVLYVDVLLLQLLWLLFYRPTEADCPECPSNLLVAGNSETAADVVRIVQGPVIGVIVAAALIALLARRWRDATPPLRRTLTPVLVAGAAFIALLILDLLLEAGGSESDAVSFLAGLALAAIPAAFLTGLLRGRLSRAAVGDLVVELSVATPTPERLETALAEALGDPTLTVGYWVPASNRFVDGTGRPVELPTEDRSRAGRILEFSGRRVAVFIYDPALQEEPELVDAVAAAAAFALENERLRAELRAQLVEVRASRSRIVASADAERRRLERNLHDGAQQRLLGLGIALQLAQSQINGQDSELVELLAEADQELRAAIEELRELARGLHPAVLTEQGLEPALNSLAERSPVPVSIAASIDGRLAAPIEIAAYYVVSEALANVAKYSKASRVTVAVTQSDRSAIVEVIDDGIGGANPAEGSGLSGLLDRVAALDGELVVESPPGEGTTIRVEIPCES